VTTFEAFKKLCKNLGLTTTLKMQIKEKKQELPSKQRREMIYQVSKDLEKKNRVGFPAGNTPVISFDK